MNVLVTKKQLTISVRCGVLWRGFYITNDDVCLGK